METSDKLVDQEDAFLLFADTHLCVFSKKTAPQRAFSMTNEKLRSIPYKVLGWTAGL